MPLNPNSKRGEIARLAKQIADHQARIQVIAANWGDEINTFLNASEKAFLSQLSRELKNFDFHPNALETLSKLRKICRRLSAIRQAAYQRAQEKITAEAGALAENEAKWAKRITKELSDPGSKFADPSAASLEKVVKFGLANGATMSEYFSQVAADDAMRIESTIRQGVESGWTIDQMVRNIAGTATNNYTDGIFETSRKSAVNMARTLTNSIANNAKETFYRANQDVLEGVEILSTLDGRTCPVCAGLDRTRYKFDEPHPALPIHHQCRCVLLPVTPLSDLVEESRPMANADFMKEAERLYKDKYPNKDFSALADSTRKKYYHEAMREYERRTGKPAYTQVSGGVSFKDYLENHMTAQQQKDWLGPQRYKLYKDYKLPLDRFIPPYPNKRLTIVELKEQDKASFAGLLDVFKSKSKQTPEKLHQKHLKKREKQLDVARRHRAEREAKLIGAKLIKGEHSIADDLLDTNPNYNPNVRDFSYNCQRCVTAYEARRRGIDVEAAKKEDDLDGFACLIRSDGTVNPTGYQTAYKNAKVEKISCRTTDACVDKIKDRMSEFGDGSRAIVRVRWKSGNSGHVFIAEHTNGETHFIDPQTNDPDVSRYFSSIKPTKTYIIRVDNLKFDDNVKKCCVSR